MPKIDITKTELVWPGKYNEDGTRKEAPPWARREGGRYLIVFFVHKRSRHALILSAREMTDSERKRYAKK